MIFKKLIRLDSTTIETLFIEESKTKDPRFQKGTVHMRLLDAHKRPVIGKHEAYGSLDFTVSYLGMSEGIPNGSVNLQHVSTLESFSKPNFTDVADWMQIAVSDFSTTDTSETAPVFVEIHVNRWEK